MSIVRAVSLAAAALLLAHGAMAQGASAATTFTIRVENVSKGEVLRLSTGGTAPFVSAPVLWAVGAAADNPLFVGGRPDAGLGLETLAETGNPARLAENIGSAAGAVTVGVAARPLGASADGPLAPGQAYEFEVTASPGQTLSLAWMFGQSNDLFYSNDRPIALFDAAGQPVTGDMTARLSLWDAGTEVNEEPGLGPNQGPRQATPDAGTAEHGSVVHVRDRFRYPRTGDVLRVTIAPSAGSVSAM
jgi:hypothetical protein